MVSRKFNAVKGLNPFICMENIIQFSFIDVVLSPIEIGFRSKKNTCSSCFAVLNRRSLTRAVDNRAALPVLVRSGSGKMAVSQHYLGIAPRGLQNGPRGPPKASQGTPKAPQETPKKPPRGAQRPPRAPEEAPGLPKRASRQSERTPRQPKRAPTDPRETPGQSKRVTEASKRPPKCSPPAPTRPPREPQRALHSSRGPSCAQDGRLTRQTSAAVQPYRFRDGRFCRD